ncbi:hypothetical protein BX265_3270 [Streptomyces sp. TLI_235]|nr:hypothetical protein [Streptomyces sp. TLI_235]PBC78498.1 hypothetical protein BX265_3270 [Streptomyces sp. TLI_235]
MSAPENATAPDSAAAPENAPPEPAEPPLPPSAAPQSAADAPEAAAAAPAGPLRGLPRGVRVALAAAGLLAVTAASATATVAVGRPDTRRPAAAAPAAAPSPTVSASVSPSAPPSSAAPAPAPTPTPASTVHGTVDGSTHGGDIRYFLLPMPARAESYGSSDGTELSTGDVAQQFGNASEMPEILRSYGYRDDAAERRYRTADGTQEVYVRLLRFKSRQMAEEFADGLSFKRGDTFDIAGDGNARGIMLKPEQEAWTGKMVGVSFSGDIEYEVTVYVKGTPDKALLVDAMKRQRERLATGG